MRWVREEKKCHFYRIVTYNSNSNKSQKKKDEVRTTHDPPRPWPWRKYISAVIIKRINWNSTQRKWKYCVGWAWACVLCSRDKIWIYFGDWIMSWYFWAWWWRNFMKKWGPTLLEGKGNRNRSLNQTKPRQAPQGRQDTEPEPGREMSPVVSSSYYKCYVMLLLFPFIIRWSALLFCSA